MIFRITFASFAITCITSTYYTFRYLDKSSDFESLHSSVLPTSSLSPRPHLSTGTSQDFEGLCSSIASTLIDLNVQVNLAEYVPNGTNLTFPDNDPYCLDPYRVVSGGDICRIALYISTSDSSGIHLEVWLPRHWSGRVLSLGNGGLSGCIDYADLDYGISLGFATVSANSGHNGTSGRPFLNAPEVIKDFSWRSVHTGIVVAKSVVERAYGKAASKSYYLGCSTGGRQGLKSSQMWPGDFDGIVAGAPVIDFNGLIGATGWLTIITGLDKTLKGFVTEALWRLVHEETLRQCDGIDGAMDGIIEDTSLCRPRIESLICPPNAENVSSCLNSDQASRVRRVLEPIYGLDGKLISPRQNPGAQLDSYRFVFSGAMNGFTVDWYRYAVYNDPKWDPSTLSLRDIAYNDALDLAGISSFDPDLSAFRDAGGKLLVFHGMQDMLITSENSDRYYHNVAEAMSSPPAVLDEFYRYFRLGGVAHCGLGPGAWSLRPTSITGKVVESSAEDNILLAMVKWVEEGVAPEYLLGTKYIDDDESKGVAFRRRHCRFPYRNIYVGPGHHTDEHSWKCVLYPGSQSK